MSTQGRCLCGSVRFEIDGLLPKLHRCHCSLCRKVTGGGSNTATLVSAHAFRWRSGTDLITSFRLDSGYRSDFCSRCGSPVPNEVKAHDDVWVPAGLLRNVEGIQLALDIHTDSAACWLAQTDVPKLGVGPESYEALKAALNSDAEKH